MRVLCRAVSWLLCVIIVVLTFVPPSFRPVTGAPHDLEHLMIFLITGAAFGLGYPNRQFVLRNWICAIYCSAGDWPAFGSRSARSLQGFYSQLPRSLVRALLDMDMVSY